MQVIKGILKVDGGNCIWSDAYGASMEAPEIVVGLKAKLQIDLRSTIINDETGLLEPYPIGEAQCGGYYFALDSDFNQATDPKMLKTSGITVSRVNGNTILSADLPNTATPGIIEHLQEKQLGKLSGEIGGYDSENPADANFVLQFEMGIRNRVYMGGGSEPGINDPEYYTAAQTDARISQQLFFEFSADGNAWHPELQLYIDRYQRARHGINGTPSAAQAIPYGRDGRVVEPDLVAPLAQRPVLAAEGFCFLAADTGDFYWMKAGAWSEPAHLTSLPGRIGPQGPVGMQGKDGPPGAVGPTGSRGEQGIQGIQGLQGDPGNGLAIDAVDAFDRRHIYDKAARGFRFLATNELLDKDGRVYQLWFQKKSDAQGDWSAGVILHAGAQGKQGEIGKTGQQGPRGENADVVPDLLFAPEDIFGGSLVIIGTRPIAAVEVYNENRDGLVVTSQYAIRTCYEENHTLIYFGAVPAYGGRVRFAQGLQAKSPYQVWLDGGHVGDEAAFLAWLQGAAVRFEFTAANLNANGTLTLPTLNPPVAVVDHNKTQWQLPQGSVSYTATTAEIDLPRVLSTAGVAEVAGIWQVLTSGGGKGEKGEKGDKGDKGDNGANGTPTLYTGATPPENPVQGMIWMV